MSSSVNSGTSKTNLLLIVVLIIVIGLSVATLVYAVQNKRELDRLEASLVKSPSTVEGFAGGDQSAQYDAHPEDLIKQRTSNKTGDWWSNNGGSANKVVDGADGAHAVTGGSAQSQCAPVATAEPAHGSLSSFSSGPSMLNVASASASAYPDETASQSLAGKTTYSCAPDVTNVGGCDYAINTDNLMPGSWREGVSCSDGTDPNSQWAKYHPTRDKYYRYITAAGSARLGANTRSPDRKILGTSLALRSAPTVPLSATATVPFMASSLHAQAIFNVKGSYPTYDISA